MKKTEPMREAKPAAALVGGAVAVLLIGLLQLLAEAAPGIKPFLTVDSGIGPLSGKVLIGYLLGFVAYFIARRLLDKKNTDLTRYLYAFVAALIIASLLVFIPFTNILLGS